MVWTFEIKASTVYPSPDTKILTRNTGLKVSLSRFPLSRKLYVRTDVNLTGYTCVSKTKGDV